MRKIVAISLAEPDAAHWRDIVPEAEDVLRGASLVGGKLIAAYLHDAYSRVRIYEPDGTYLRDVEFPGLGTVTGFGGKFDDPETFYDFSNFTRPSTIYRYNVSTGETSIFRAPALKFNPDDYQTRQVFYTSKDGTRVPMFLTHRKDWKPDGKTPTLLYGYGGFDISLTPSFSVMNLVWLEMGGLYAVPNLRGGGEYGRKWHEAGMLANKQNVFDDFIAAAEWLIAQGYTCPEKLAIRGGSNGGLLVGAVMTQRPDLFGAALPAVGVMDMLRYHKFTIGWAWVSEYGSSDDPEQFKVLLKYSPYHNLRPGVRYPSTLVTTGDHDDRVVPGHSYKFAAALQHAHSGDNPVLIRIETRAGHGAGTPTSKMIQLSADTLAFLAAELKMEIPWATPSKEPPQP
jgi:prolyl oligopeptidase